MSKNCIVIKRIITTVVFAGIGFFKISAQGGYVTGDFHQHTTYTHGIYTMGHVMEMNNKYGLDWWANSEHGGGWETWGFVSGADMGTGVKWKDVSGVTLKGTPNLHSMWRWQSLSEFSFRDIQLYRRVFTNKLIFQGFEWNVPGHEHASVGILGNQFASHSSDVYALAQFEYLFDASDTDQSQPLRVTKQKNTINNHKKAVEAVQWLQAHFPLQSWVVAAHPERLKYPGLETYGLYGYNIEHLRDMNNAAPDVFFGFESVPGHQKMKNRGEYGGIVLIGGGVSYGGSTYGGAGYMSSKVGGVWDALLSEGRRFWLFASSDFHTDDDEFFPGEYQKTYTYVTEKNNPQALVDGLRSGNSYVVHGDLIDVLDFTIHGVPMGGEYPTSDNEITITIRLRDPLGDNFNTYSSYTNPELNHFDLIAGKITGKIAPPTEVPANGVSGYSEEYKKDFVETTQVIARFGKTAASADPCGVETIAWEDEGEGFIHVSYQTTITDGEKMYFRLRGTNHALDTPHQTDACGNPLADAKGENNAAKAFEDLWFYSNPIFVTNTNPNSLQKVNNNALRIHPNPAKNSVTIETNEEIKHIRVLTLNGQEIISQKNNTQVDLSTVEEGVYLICVETATDNYTERMVVKK